MTYPADAVDVFTVTLVPGQPLPEPSELQARAEQCREDSERWTPGTPPEPKTSKR